LGEAWKRDRLRNAIDNFGLEAIKSAVRKSKLLSVSIAELAKAGGSEESPAVKGLTELEGEISALVPRKAHFIKKGFLGVLFNPKKASFPLPSLRGSLKGESTELRIG
jgi:hypothetical protein